MELSENSPNTFITKDTFLKYLKAGGIYTVLLLLLALIIYKEPSFVSLRNLSNILTQSSVKLIMALGVGGIILTAGCDLSVGKMVGMAGVVSASLLQASDTVGKVFPNLGEIPVLPVLIAMIFLGAFLGFLNGLIVAYLKVTPFVATLGSSFVFLGINSLYYDYLGAAPISNFSDAYANMTQGVISLGHFNISYLLIYAAIASVIMWIIWNKTTLGKNIYAVGGNPEAAKVSGVNVAKTLVIVYVIAGAFYGFAGFLEAGRVGSATSSMGTQFELDAIAACVVGGVSLFGGIGRVTGVILGVLIFSIVAYGLTYIGVSPNWQLIFKGGIIIFAVAVDSLTNAKKS